MELTQSYFHLVQHSIALTIIEPKFRRLKPPIPLPPRMEPERIVELFLDGAAGPKDAMTNGNSKKSVNRNGAARKTTKALAVVASLGLGLLSTHAQTTNTPASTNEPSSTAAAPAPLAPSNTSTNAAPVMPDVRPIPLAVKASHPELATISPIAENAKNIHALDLQTCFQLTAVRDDSLKISMEDIEIARAQLSQSIAALWPTFTVNNQQQFLHYRGANAGGFTILGNSTISGDRNYTSQSHVQMSYTIFNGFQNYNNVGASSAAIAAKKQTLARNYQTIYQGRRAGFLQRAAIRGRHERPSRSY